MNFSPIKTFSLIVFLLLLISAENSLMAQSNHLLLAGEEHAIFSESLQEERTYLIHLPDSYEGDEFYVDKKYPVLIVLDGERLFQLTAGMVQSMSQGGVEQVPEMIVVGVLNTNRNRDMIPTRSAIGPNGERNESLSNSGGADAFLSFLEKELLPFIDETYRTSNTKVLMGHSFAGLFAIHALYKESLFNAYLAIDPSLWWDDALINTQLERNIDQLKDMPRTIYLSKSNNPFSPGEYENRNGQAYAGFKSLVARHANEYLDIKFEYFEEEDHFSIPTISLYKGLQRIFEGYKYPLKKIASQPVENIRQHYQSLSERLGGDLLPPGKLINQVALYLLNSEHQVESAIALLQLNTDYYSQSYIPFYHLAEAYAANGDRDKAIQNFEQVLKMNPTHESARENLERLKDE